MSTTMDQRSSALNTTLDDSTSGVVLADAVARRVPIQLSAAAALHDAVWRGAFRDGADDVLVLVAVDRWVEVPDTWDGVALRATFCVANQAYAFDTHLVAPRPNQSADAITVRMPDRIEKIERRRAPRQRLHPSTRVRVHIDGGGVPVELSLLNLSEQGMACRADPRAVDILRAGSSVRVTFDLPEMAEPLDLDARLATVTPSGGGEAVLGLEFVDNEKLRRQRGPLRTALSTTIPPDATGRTGSAHIGGTTL